MRKVLKPINKNPIPPYIDENIFYVCPLIGDNRALIFPNEDILDIREHLTWHKKERP